MAVKRWLAVVVAVALAGLVTPPAAQAAGLPPSPPTNLHASYDAAADAYVLNWDAPAINGSYSYQLYRGDTIIADSTQRSYTDANYGTFNLYYVTASNENGTSAPSSPVGIVTCGSTPSCSPDAASQAAAWNHYRFIDYSSGFIAICDVAAVNLFPFGYVVYFDCIRQMLHGISPLFATQVNSCMVVVQFHMYGNRCIP
jgi:hypothetical protein